jgi:hypothetical protein
MSDKLCALPAPAGKEPYFDAQAPPGTYTSTEGPFQSKDRFSLKPQCFHRVEPRRKVGRD